MRKKILYLLPVLILAAGFAAMRFFAGMGTAPPRREPPPPIKYAQIEVVRLRDLQAHVTAYGRVRSAQPVILYSEVTGTLERGDVPFRPGQTIRRGDLIVKIDDRQIRLDINTTKSELLNALASVLPEIRVDFPGQYPVWEDYFNNCTFDRPLPDLPQAANQKIKLYLSRFNVYRLYFTIRDLEIQYEKHFVYAPFDGSITEADLRVGSNARPGTRLGEIINLESLEAEMPVPAGDLQWIEPGEPVQLTSREFAGSWTGRVRRIGKKTDTRTQTVQVYIAVDAGGDERLHDGVFLEAAIPGRTIPGAVAVPRRALYEESFVYVIEDGHLRYRKVAVARREPDHVIVTGGLHAGDLLVVEMLQGVSDGMLARPRNGGQGGNPS